MTTKNTTNFKFLKDEKPELYELALKMEEELLISPVSMLAYSTRFLEFILHDLANKYHYNANTKLGFVEKVNELIRFKHLDNNLDYNLPQLLIDAYNDRSYAIHNHHIEESLRNDESIAFRLNETLFYVADAYYKKITGNKDEEHFYTKPELAIESTNDFLDSKNHSLDYGHVSYSKPKSAKKSKEVKTVKRDNGHVSEPKSINDSSSIKKQWYVPKQDSQGIDENEIRKFVTLLEEGYSPQNALKHVDIAQPILNNWYMDKKSEFVDGNKDELFIRYNELLIDNSIKLITENRSPGNVSQKLEFWMQYFEEFIDEKSQSLTEDQLRLFKIVFRKNTPKKDKTSITKEYDRKISVKPSPIDKKELEKRVELMLKYIERYNFKVSLKKSKLRLTDFQRSKKEFLMGKRNNFYHKLSEKLMGKYLVFRKDGKSTAEFCRKMAIGRNEVNFWIDCDLFKDFHIRYNRIRLILFKKAMENNKSLKLVLNDLEMDEDQFSDLIKLVNDDAEYVDVRPIIRQYYNPYSLEVFMNEFRKNPNIDEALKKSNLTKKDLEMYLSSNKELYDEYCEIKNDKIIKSKINNEGVNLNHLDMSQEEYSQIEVEINEKVEDKQIKELTNGLSGGMLLVIASNMGFDIDTVFGWIFEGSIGNNKYNDFANKYWEAHIDYINSLNSNGRYNLKTSHNLEIFGLQTHKDYWMKWGLIDENNTKFTINDIKNILRK